MSETATAPTGAQTLNLVKGQKLDITKSNPGLTYVNIGMGWDAAPSGGKDCDLDAFAICLDGDGRCVNWPQNVLFFNSPKNGAGKLSIHNDAVVHSGDNLTGAGDGDDETIELNLAALPSDVAAVVLCANIYEAKERNQNFGQVKNAYIRAYAKNEGTELLKFDLQEDYGTATAVIFGKVYRRDAEWKFEAIGEGVTGTISEIAAKYA